jgi:transcriptional regulator with GAF, ATPase, and Fis domain
MQEVVSAIEQVAASRATVLIRGESGTGKELIAKLVHAKSPRRSGPFVKVDCAAIPDNLLEDELFGHVKGAFTGAAGRRRGKFEAADGGTIFLDEVGELPLHLQPKLLRVLQEREIEPLGGDETRVVDVRVVAATNRDLAAMAAAGTFREDLFYRLNVVPVVVPPLRERPEDVAPLAKFFLDRFSESGGRKTGGFTAAALAELSGRPWPGNVRELENCVERAAIFRTGDLVDVADLGSGPPGASLDRADRAAAAAVDALFGERTGLDDFERKIIGEALRRCEGNVSLAARRLGLSRRALQYRVEKMRADAASESSARARHSDDQDGEDRP